MAEQVSPMQVEHERSALQTFVVALSGLLLVWSIAGLVVHPDFGTGSDLSAEKVLGADMNGWHAVSGILLFAPGLVAAMRAQWAYVYSLAAAAGLIASGIWILFDSSPAGLLALPDNEFDALVFHLLPGVLYLGAALIHRGR